MRICLATPLYPPEEGGPATYVGVLEQYLPDEAVELTVVKFSEVRRYPKVFRHLTYGWKVYRAARGADIVFALDPVSTGLPALLAARMRGLPFVVKIVGDYAWEQGRQRFGITDTLDKFVTQKNVPTSVQALRRVQEYVARSATQIIVPSKYLKKIVTTWGISESAIRVIYNAVTKEPKESLPDIVLALSKPRIVTVARLVPWKGVDVLIEIVGKLREKFPSVSLVIVGNGPERERLEIQAKEQLGSGYFFTGSVSNAMAQSLMAEADVFALNTSYEGFSHVIIEALASGTPIVTTPVGGTVEILKGGENVLFCTPNNNEEWASAITKLLENSELRTTLKEGAKKTTEEFSPKNMVHQTATLLKTLV